MPGVELMQNQNSLHTSKMTGYAFTNNWFDKHVQVWSTLLESFHPSRILEVGCYEGKSTTFLIDKIANQRDLEIHCVDTWEGGIEHIDNEKYDVIDNITLKIKDLKNKNIKIEGQEIVDILTVNGIRFTLNDGSWGLIRASSNKPSLVIVTESPTSDKIKKEIFNFIDKLLQETGKIGEYDQKI